jgi:signal transduction histidine kinase
MSEADDVRRAFEQFMMGGNDKFPAVAQEVVKSNNMERLEAEEELLVKKAERKYWQILKAFQGTLERDWLQVDDNLHDVVSSIANLRGRIAMESRLLAKKDSVNLWNGHGYHATPCSLRREDVELALSYDLRQHEKMMTGARTLLASLSEAQEALGRRLEELMLHHFLEMKQSITLWASVVDRLQQVFCELAMELYRKQVLVQSLLDAVNDNLLVAQDDESAEEYVNPRRVADKCCQEWPRGSKKSNVSVKVLDGLLQLGERGSME